MNFGKTGASLSFGTKGLRHTIHSSGRRTSSVGIPGTGISYVTSSGSGKRRYTSQAYIKRQQIQMQKEQQRLNEIQQNALLVEEYENRVDMLKGIHKECDESIDWQYIYSTEEPFDTKGMGPKQAKALADFESYKPSLFEKIIKSIGEKKKLNLEKAIEKATQEDAKAYEEWKNLNLLSGRIIRGDIDAYLDVINEMNPLDDLLEFGSDFEFGTDSPSAMEVEFRVKLDTVVPDFSISLTKTGKLSKRGLTKTAYYDLVQDYTCSCAMRIARDIFALLPLKNIVVHAVEETVNRETGCKEDMTILSVLFERDVLNSLNFESIDPSDAMNNFKHNMKHLKTVGFRAVERIVN